MKYNVTTKKLNNSSEILIINVPNSDSCFFGYGVRAGANYAPREKAEIAHLLEHLSFNGNKLYPQKNDFLFEAERNGIRLNASTGPYHISFTYNSGKEFVLNSVKLALAQLISPVFPDDLLENEKEVIRRELEPKIDNIYGKCADNLFFKLNPHKPSYEERIASLANISNQDIQKYYLTHFVSKNTQFALAGSFTDTEISQIIKLIEVELADYPKGEEMPILHHTPKNYKKLLLAEDSKRAERNCIDLTFINTHFSNLDSPEMKVFYAMFNDGTYSRIFRTTRSRGISYSLRSGYSLNRDYSEVYISDKSSRDNSLKVFDASIKELKEFINGNFTDKEIERAKGFVKGDLELDHETATDILNWFLPKFSEGEILIDFNDYLCQIDGVSRESLTRAIKEFFEGTDWALSILGPTAKMDSKEYLKIINQYFSEK